MPSKKTPASSPDQSSPRPTDELLASIICNLDDAEGLLEFLSVVAESVVNNADTEDLESQARLWRGIQVIQGDIFERVMAVRSITRHLDEIPKTGGAR